ncbi:MAG: hypothetical protein K2G92_00615, partial [Duncaniella sp.]|nr:hypothetical protein [Duncaniella sp.]
CYHGRVIAVSQKNICLRVFFDVPLPMIIKIVGIEKVRSTVTLFHLLNVMNDFVRLTIRY